LRAARTIATYGVRQAAVIAVAIFAACVGARAAEFRVSAYGAKGDGKTIDTAAIQRAIDAAEKTGHGTVVFTPGVYLTGSIFLKTGINLRVEKGAIVRGVQTLSAYPEMWTRVAGIEMTWPAALVNVYEQSNVRIYGHGIIDGNGKFWWDKYWRMRRVYDAEGLRWAVDYDCQRPRLIQIYKSSHVSLQGLRLERSGFWTVHICYSTQVVVNGVTIRNNIGGRGPSTDGIDIDSSTHVLVEHCDISDNDDAICLKAGRDADGLRVNKPTEDVVIRDSIVRDGAAGFTIGSETSGYIRNVLVEGITVLAPVPKGIYFKSAKTRGGGIENVRIRDMRMVGVAVPIGVDLNWNQTYSYAHLPPGMKKVPRYWRVLAEPVPLQKGLPHLRDISISDISATRARQAFAVKGYPQAPLENFNFKNIRIQARTAGSIQDAANWTFVDTRVQVGDGSRVKLNDCQNIRGLGKN
jgi:polygalacturonase